MMKQATMCITRSFFSIYYLPITDETSVIASKNIFGEFIQRFRLFHKHFKPFSIFFPKKNKCKNKQKMFVTNKKMFGRTQKFLKKNSKSEKFSNEKNFPQTKKISAEAFFVCEVFTTIRKNENLRNEDSKSLFVTKIYSMPIS